MSETINQTHPLITRDHLRRLAVVYCRQSTGRQVEHNTGSTAYQRGLVEVASDYGWDEFRIITIDEDLGRSGSTTQGRTGWERLQEMIEADQVGAVFAANISRLARQVYDFEVFRMRAALHHTLLYSDGRLTDPANSNDTIVSQMMSMVAHFENRKRAELMTQSRLAKAKRGEVVTKLAVGWIKEPDGKYDFDPQIKDTIRMIIEIFWQTRSVRQTVKTLIKAGIQIPCRKRGQINFSKPTIGRVRFILTDPTYAGSYIYRKTQSEPGVVMASGHSKRVRLSEEHWIKHHNHHPAYMTLEEQEKIKAILNTNRYRRRPGRGRAMMQGLLRCGVCGRTLSVTYPAKAYLYSCSKSSRYGEKPCMSFTGSDLEACILREVFKVLRMPPIEMLKSALEAAGKNKQTRKSWIRSERERLLHEETVARERAGIAQGRLESVYYDSLEKLDKVLLEKKQFEEKIALERLAPSEQESEEELDELCRLVSEVPSLWQHEEMSNQERKEILRCLINPIVVSVTEEKIEATILWKAGGKTTVFIWRRAGYHHLIRELHAQQLTATTIKEHLAAGKTSTGQIVKIGWKRLYCTMRDLGLKAPLYTAGYYIARQKAAELYREGRSTEWILQYFKDQGFSAAWGKTWTSSMVEGLLRAIGDKSQSLKETHQRLIEEALARGLNHREIAREFNQKNIRLRGRPPWTEHKITKTCRKLGLPRDRETKETTEQAEPAALNKSTEQKLSDRGAKRFPSRRRLLSRSKDRRRQAVLSRIPRAKRQNR